MTAEVVIGNGFGIVVAADGATTKGDSRTYDGAMKIIGLPTPHALAVLHTGNVLFHGIPSSTLVENWIQTLPAQRLNRVEDYMDSFLEFVKEDVKSFSTEVEMGRTFLQEWNKRLHNIYYYLRDRGEMNPEGVRVYFQKLLNDLSEVTPQQEAWADKLFKTFGENSPLNILEEDCRANNCENMIHSSIEAWTRYWFGDETDDEGLDLALRWARNWLSKWHPATIRNLITFVGYGEKQSLPVLDSHNLEGVLLDRLFHSANKHSKAQQSEAGYALFETFGQDREIRRFVREAGLDLNYSRRIIEEKLQNRDREVDSSIAEEAAAEESNLYVPNANKFGDIATELTSGIDNVADRNEWEVLQSFAGLNLNNCASIAARFIHLTNLAFDIRGELPTVSSDVTIGVITKAHGFAFINSTGWQTA